MLAKEEFISAISKLKRPTSSKTGAATYGSFRLHGNMLHFIRIEKQTEWKLDVNVLFSIYKSNKFINTVVVKQTENRKVNSPSVAVLMAIGCIDKAGNRIG